MTKEKKPVATTFLIQQCRSFSSARKVAETTSRTSLPDAWAWISTPRKYAMCRAKFLMFSAIGRWFLTGCRTYKRCRRNVCIRKNRQESSCNADRSAAAVALQKLPPQLLHREKRRKSAVARRRNNCKCNNSASSYCNSGKRPGLET